MVWRQYPNETSGVGGAVAYDGAGHNDWNDASALNRLWEAIALSASAITVSGDGKYTVTFSGAQNVDDILGTTDGDVVIVKADVTGAGAALTIRNNGGGTGNIRTNASVDIVLASDTEWAMFTHIGSVLTGGKIYGA